jgi:hypothetical protein
MKVLIVLTYLHHKNLNFIMKCKKIKFTTINRVNDIDNYNLNEFDAVISPSDPINVSKYPNVKFIFGPHFSVFPNDKLNIIKSPNTIYNSLSEWVVDVWKQYEICSNLKFVSLPYGVDTDKFINNKHISERSEVFIYFKHRNPQELNVVEHFLKNKNVSYKIFSYNLRYDENSYLNFLQNAKYGIWVDAHESQGFALQEALSCDVPLLVWDVQSMCQEFNSHYPNYKATTTSYWDNSCGEKFYNSFELEEIYNTFINNIENYNPRKFIVDNLSIEMCENKLIETINNMNIN